MQYKAKFMGIPVISIQRKGEDRVIKVLGLFKILKNEERILVCFLFLPIFRKSLLIGRIQKELLRLANYVDYCNGRNDIMEDRLNNANDEIILLNENINLTNQKVDLLIHRVNSGEKI